MSRLKDKVAIVTGGAGGIGAASAQRFVEEGARVLMVDRDEAALARAAAQIGAAASSFVADVSDERQVDAYTQAAVERYGGLDVVLLNAGTFGVLSSIEDYSVQAWDRVVAVNLRGAWLGLRAAIPHLRKRGGGSIIVTSSIQGFSAFPNSSPYTCTKHAVVGMMRNAALELARDNIRVNTVHPGLTDTDMMGYLHRTAAPGAPQAAMDAFAKTAPMRRYAQPREIANMMLFLASDEASYCSGACYVVDGALTASWAPTPD